MSRIKKKKVNTHRHHSPNILMFLGYCLVLTLIIKLMLDTTVIEIIPTGQSNSASKGVNVHISEITKNNNQPYDLVAIKPEAWHTIWDTNIENYGDSAHPLRIETRRYDSLQITFFNNPYMGIVEIKTPLRDYRIDLYTEAEYGTSIIDIPFSTARNGSWFLSIVFGTIFAIFFRGLFYILHHSKSLITQRVLAVIFGCIGGGILILTNLDYGLWLNLLLVLSYGFFSGLALPSMFQGRYNPFLINRMFYLISMLAMSAFASIASLYPQLIRPYYSFQIGIYNVTQFIIFWMFWFFCILVAFDRISSALASSS